MEPDRDEVEFESAIRDELREYQENQQRSEDEGWFYSDDDE